MVLTTARDCKVLAFLNECSTNPTPRNLLLMYEVFPLLADRAFSMRYLHNTIYVHDYLTQPKSTQWFDTHMLEKLFSLIFFGRRPRSGVSLAADGREKSLVRIETMRLIAPTNAAFGRLGTHRRRRRGGTIRVSEMRMWIEEVRQVVGWNVERAERVILFHVTAVTTERRKWRRESEEEERQRGDWRRWNGR